MSCRPAVKLRRRRFKSILQARLQAHRRARRVARRDMRLSPEARVDLWRRLRGLPRLCEACRRCRGSVKCNLPGNWLPTLLCDSCLHGEDQGKSWWDSGWRPLCRDCGGSGQFDDSVPCEVCDGEGVIDW